jgi:type II secretory pathway pseudopilin PulG
VSASRPEKTQKIGDRASGLTLIELLMTLALLTVLVVVSIAPIGDSIEEQRFELTRQKLDQIRVALIGDPRVREGGSRSSFGYFGDIGDFPPEADGLAALVTQPGGVSTFGVDTTHRLGIGWRGPYFEESSTPALTWNDGWNQPLAYTYDGATLTVTSQGADLAAGGTGYDQDLTLTLDRADFVATLHGFISNNGSPLTEAFDVEIASADGTGSLTVTTESFADTAAGAFSIASIPFGRRSVTVSIPTLAKTLGPLAVSVDRKEVEIPPGLLELNP